MFKKLSIRKIVALVTVGLFGSTSFAFAQPSWSSGYPKSSSGASSIDFTVKSNQSSTIYYVIYKSDQANLTASAVKSAATGSIITDIQKKGSITLAAGDTNLIIASEMPDNKTYYSYLVAESGGVLMADVSVKKYISVLEKKQKELSYTSNPSLGDGQLHGYLLYYPEEYYRNPTKTFPLLVVLHGQGEKGTLNYGNLTRHGPAKLIQGGREFPFIVATPQTYIFAGGWATKVVNEFIDKMSNENRVNTNKVYLTGFSMGGGGSFLYTGVYPNKIAAVVPIAGWGSAGNCNMKNVPVWAFHNNDDGTVGVAGTNNAIASINACNTPPPIAAKKTIYTSGGHDAWTKTYDGTGGYDIYTWMLQYSKNVVPTVIIPPIVNAGVDKFINLPTNSIAIAGTATDPNGTINSYTWTKIAGSTVTLTNQTTSTLTVSNMVQGNYTFRLIVIDNSGNQSFDDVVVSVLPSGNNIPSANAGVDKVITLPVNSLTINGAGTDVNGTITGYLWSKNSGANCTLTNTSSQNLTVSSLLAGEYEFKLTVTDNSGSTATDLMRVTVNSAANLLPTISIIAPVQNLQIIEGNLLQIVANASDLDGSITKVEFYAGSLKIGEDLTSPYNFIISTLLAGNYIISTKAFDNAGASTTSALVSIQILPSSLCTSTGTILREEWINNSGNLITQSIFDGLVNSSSFLTSFEGPIDISDNYSSRLRGYICAPVTGNYTFWVSGDDDCELYLSSDSTSQNKTLIAFVSGYTDYRQYTKFASQQSSTKFLTAGQKYYLEGKHKEGSGKDNISVGWQLPDGTLQRPINGQYLSSYINKLPSITLATTLQANVDAGNLIIPASAVDLDGSIVSYTWSKSGSNDLILNNISTPNLGISNLSVGTFIFTLTVKDNSNQTSSSNISVTINSVSNPVNINAGSDVYTFSNVPSLTILAITNLPANQISQIQWTQISGNNTLSVSGSNSLNLIINQLVAGNFSFEIMVKNLQNQVAKDTLNIFIAAPIGTSLYRINAGGIQVNDQPIDWSNDNAMNSNPNLSSNNKGQISGSGTWNYTNTTSAPNSVFSTYRFSTSTTDPLTYSFPVQNGNFEVRLYFSETNLTIKSGGYSRVFDIKIENQLVLQGLNIFAEAGSSALQKTFFVSVTDGELDVSFIKNLSNPLINALEIIGLNGVGIPAKTSTQVKSDLIEKNKIFVKAYPNPFDENLTIESDVLENSTLILSDIAGRVLFTQTINPGITEINTENLNLSAGVYLLKITDSNKQQQTIKLIKN